MINDAYARLDPGYQALQRELRYRFKDLELLRRALTHSSYANEFDPGDSVAARQHNERLEFLGDAVVGLTVGHLLMDRLPEAREGQLTKLRAMVVSEGGLSAAARRLGLGPHLRLGRGEEQGGGRTKPSILSDAFEALLGGIFLDGGFEVAQRIVRERLGELVEAAVRGDLDRDFKTRLQETLAANGEPSPRYQLERERGPDHAKVFTVSVWCGDALLATAEGGSKKSAEQQAAELALESSAAALVEP